MRKLGFQKIRLRIFMDLINELNLTMDKWIDTYSKKMGADNCITLSSDLLVEVIFSYQKLQIIRIKNFTKQ